MHGNIEGSFTIHDINIRRGEIWITDPNTVITKSEFAKVFPLWGDYCKGVVPRVRLRDLTTRSTYIISIMHWLEISN